MKKELRQRLQKYGLGAAAIVAGTTASGQVVYTDVIPDDTVSGNGDSYLLDLDNNASVDFNLLVYSGTYSNSYYGVFYSLQAMGGSALGSNRFMNDTYGYAYALNNGTPINNGAASWGSSALMRANYFVSYLGSTYNYSYGNWGIAPDRYLGLRLNVAGSLHYGWVRISVLSNNTFVVHDYAYESTANASIDAGDDSTSTAPVQILPATNIIGTDIANNGNGADLQVTFDMATDETGLAEYRILVVKDAAAGSFTMLDAQGIPASNRTDVAPTGSNITQVLSAGANDVDGDPIVENEPYRVFVLSVADGVDAMIDSLSQVSNQVILTAPPADIASNLVLSDIADNGNGLDLQLGFTKAPDESTVSTYRVIIVKSVNAGTFDLAAAEALTAVSYKTVTPNGTDPTVVMDAAMLDADGDPITNAVPYKAFVLSMADGTNATTNSLSGTSNEIMLIDWASGVASVDRNNDLTVTQAGNTLQLRHRSGEVISEARLYDLNGRLLTTQSNRTAHMSVPVGEMATGVYILEAHAGEQVIRKQIYIAAL